MKERNDQGSGQSVASAGRPSIGTRYVLSILLISICLCGTFPILRAVLDPIPKARVSIGSFPMQDVESYATPGLVLWDLSHSKSPLGDSWHSIYDDQEIRQYLKAEGYTFDLSEVGVLQLDISSYSLIVLEHGCCANKSAYSLEEAEILYTYVNSGGALLLFGENSSVENSQSLSPVSRKFGIELPNGNTYQYYDGVYYFEDHPITNGVSQLSFRGAGVLGVSPPATPVGWNFYRSIAISVAEIGKGKVVAMGDSDFITTEYLSEMKGDLS